MGGGGSTDRPKEAADAVTNISQNHARYGRFTHVGPGFSLVRPLGVTVCNVHSHTHTPPHPPPPLHARTPTRPSMRTDPGRRGGGRDECRYQRSSPRRPGTGARWVHLADGTMSAPARCQTRGGELGPRFTHHLAPHARTHPPTTHGRTRHSLPPPPSPRTYHLSIVPAGPACNSARTSCPSAAAATARVWRT